MLPDSAIQLLAAATWAALAAGVAVWVLASWKRTQYSLGQAPIMLYSTLMTRGAWRTRVVGRFAVPDGQGAILVCNHIAGIDPAVIALATRRPVHWMVAREYCTHPALGWFFGTLGCIPVNRGGIDTAATKMAIRLAQQGELVGMFPEGRLNTTSELLLPGRPGAALVALRARVPVVPCCVRDTPMQDGVFSSLFMTARAELRIGQPIDLSPWFERQGEEGVLEDLTRRFMSEIARLAGVPDYRPRLAGKRWRTGEESVEPAAV